MITRFLFYLHELRKNLRLEPSGLQKIQRKKLRAIIKYAYENVPFYHRKFDKAGVKPDDVNSVADLLKVPVTTKSEIQAESLEDVVARNVDISKCIKKTTSGSTGVPLTIIVHERTADFENAVWVRDKMAVIADPRGFPKNTRWFQHLGINRRKYISIFDRAQRQLALIEKYSPDVIKAYPSSVKILGANICRHNGMVVKPRLIFTCAELLDIESRRFINSTFGTELIDNYACSEFGLLAWECREHVGYHLNAESIVMEFVNDGKAVAPSERGEIVCTSLVNYAMPLIRYKVGDVGVPVEEQCSCGRTLPLMKIVEGRTDDFLTALDGRVISPTVFFPYPFEDFEGIMQFRVIQERRDRLTIQLVANEAIPNDAQVFGKVRRKIQKLFGAGMHVEFQLIEKIDRDSTGKIRKIISRVPTCWRR